jgi:polysaccharide pyruvyl transferase WcaK-like protein
MNGDCMKIGLLHHTGGGNLGDESTQEAMIQNIKGRWPRASFIGLTMNPDDTRVRHGIASYPLRRKTWTMGYRADAEPETPRSKVAAHLRRFPLLLGLLRTIYALIVRMPRSVYEEFAFLIRSWRIVRSLDLLIVNGGGQLTEWCGPWEFTYTVFKWVLLARVTKVPCYFLNVGAGPLTQPLSRFFAKWALNCAAYVSFRDEESRTLASQIGYTGPSQVYPDSVYSLDIPAQRRCRSCRTGRKPIVGIAPMPYCDPRVFAEKDQSVYDAYIRKLGRFAAHLIRNGCTVALLSGDIGVDPMAVEDLQKALKNEGIAAASQSVTAGQVRSTGELLAGMAAVDYLVVTRFHGVVFAHLLNKPVVALSHHPKVAALMSDLGLSRYCIQNLRTFDDELLAQTFQELMNHGDEIKGRMAEQLAVYRGRLSGQFDELFPRSTS